MKVGNLRHSAFRIPRLPLDGKVYDKLTDDTHSLERPFRSLYCPFLSLTYLLLGRLGKYGLLV